MPDPAVPKVTTEILWRAAFFFAVVDAVLVAVLATRVSRAEFLQYRRVLVLVSGVFWFLVWVAMCAWFWVPVYSYVFPPWARWVIPPVYGLLFAVVSLLFWWVVVRVRVNPVIGFCALGGLWGMLTHIWAISRGILDGPPMLQGASPVAASVMPIFEFAFYWSIIVTVTRRLVRYRGSRGGAVETAR